MEPEELCLPERERSSPPLYYFTTEEGSTKPAVSDSPLPAMFLAEVVHSVILASSRHVTDVGSLLLSKRKKKKSPSELEIWVLVRTNGHRPRGGWCLRPRDAALLWGVGIDGKGGTGQRSVWFRPPVFWGMRGALVPAKRSQKVMLQGFCQTNAPLGEELQCELGPGGNWSFNHLVQK